jgi:hypothetical protein
MVVSALIQDEFAVRSLLWCIVPVSVVWYVLAQPRASIT